MRYSLKQIVLIKLFSIAVLIAQIPQTINYQGLLSNNDGTAVANGNYSVTFRLYNVSAEGSALWTETQSLAVSDGIFNAVLGSISLLTLPFDERYWLGISIGTGEELSPRIELTSSAYSLVTRSVIGDSNYFPASGNVGIGLTEAAEEKLQVAGTVYSMSGGFRFPDGTVQTTAIDTGKIKTGELIDNSVTTNTIADDAVTIKKIGPDIISSINGVSNDGGNIDLVAGANIYITVNDEKNKIILSATDGKNRSKIGVIAGEGLSSESDDINIILNANAGKGLTIDADSIVLDSNYTDIRYINEDQDNSVNTEMIIDGSVGTVDLADNAITAVKINPDIISSLNNVSNDGGNIELLAGDNITITANDTLNTITITGVSTAAGNSLDQAYDHGGPGDGRTITADAGAFQVDGTDGVLFDGTFNSGAIPAEGSGVRMMWYPGRAAFRVGGVTGAQWNADSIGYYSFASGFNTKAKNIYSTAMGYSTTASGSYSTAMGYSTTASSSYSTSMGQNTTASGISSTAMGYSTTASSRYSTAMGLGTTASGGNSTAMGWSTTASGIASTAMGLSTTTNGYASTAMGSYVSTSGAGALIIGDNSTTTTLTSATDNRFSARFAGGYYLFTNSAANVGAALTAGANSWAVISDSSKKENFKTVDGEEVLEKISRFKLASWNYKGQDKTQYRHYGPMAQDFHKAFGNDGIGIIGNDTTISSADFDGINFIAIQALEKRTTQNEKLSREITALKDENKVLKQKLHDLQSVVQKLQVLFTENQKKVNNSTAELVINAQ
jgi:hypothetical protein